MTEEKNTNAEEQKEVAAEETQAAPVVETAEAKEEKKPAKEEKAKKQAKYTRTAKGKKRAVKSVPRGRAYVQASLNNTIVTITDPNGNTLCWASAGGSGFRGPKKATPFAASQVVEKLAERAEKYGVKDLHVIVTGIGGGRDSAIRTLNAQGFNILSIKEVTPVAHNGCRPRRARRV